MAKRLSTNVIKGQTGINIVEEAVLGMGFKWSAGNGSLDTGIDGDIEIVDPITREAKNVLIRAQVKGRVQFEKETATSFEFTCSKDDIDYWMGGNAPVILILVRLGDRKAWWISVRDWFADAARRRTGRAVFDKSADRFDQHTGTKLLAISQQHGSNAYISPKRKSERLVSNLQEIVRLPSSLYMAETTHRDPREMRDALRLHMDWPPREWFLQDGRIYSVHNLREEPWRSICDIGTVESIETSEWSRADERGAKHGFIRLLDACLSQRIAPMGLIWNKTEECYFYKPRIEKSTGKLISRSVSYASLKQRASRIVFQGYPSRKDPSTMGFYRHHGFKSRFHRIFNTWFLEITPRYVFTSDGFQPHAFREELQAKLKTIEGGAAVRGTVVMFASLLKDEASLFNTPYPHIGFGELAETEVNVSIDDGTWSSRDELQPSAQSEREEVDAGLFSS